MKNASYLIVCLVFTLDVLATWEVVSGLFPKNSNFKVGLYLVKALLSSFFFYRTIEFSISYKNLSFCDIPMIIHWDDIGVHFTRVTSLFGLLGTPGDHRVRATTITVTVFTTVVHFTSVSPSHPGFQSLTYNRCCLCAYVVHTCAYVWRCDALKYTEYCHHTITICVTSGVVMGRVDEIKSSVFLYLSGTFRWCLVFYSSWQRHCVHWYSCLTGEESAVHIG